MLLIEIVGHYSKILIKMINFILEHVYFVLCKHYEI